MSMFRLPGPADRTWIVGHTGSGKSHAALWLLSHQDYDRRPWVVLDFKGERLIRDIPRLRRLKPGSEAPRHPGVHHLPYGPQDEGAIEAFLWRLWKRGKTGIMVDEGHALPGDGGIRSDAVKALASQGRSKRIPMIVVSQQPSWISRFVKSQADHFYVFHLNSREDYKALGEMIPGDVQDQVEPLPERHFLAHDVARRLSFIVPPLPDRDSILNRFDLRQPAGFWADLPTRPRP